MWSPSGSCWSMVSGGDPGGGEAGGFGALGGVLREVAGGGELLGDEFVGDAAVPGQGEGFDVEALVDVAPADLPPVRPVRVRRGGEGDRGDGVAEGVGDVVDRDAGRRDDDGVGVGGVDAVEADQGVEVHDAAALHFGGLAVGELHRRTSRTLPPSVKTSTGGRPRVRQSWVR